MIKIKRKFSSEFCGNICLKKFFFEVQVNFVLDDFRPHKIYFIYLPAKPLCVNPSILCFCVPFSHFLEVSLVSASYPHFSTIFALNKSVDIKAKYPI